MASGVVRPWGHSSGGPRGVADQSVSRMRLAIALSPGKVRIATLRSLKLHLPGQVRPGTHRRAESSVAAEVVRAGA